MLLFCMPRMVRNMVREIVGEEEGLRVVGELSCDQSLLEAAKESGADFVVLGTTRPGLSAEAKQALQGLPALRILAIAMRDGHGFLYEMRPYRVPLGAISPALLIDALSGPNTGGEVLAGTG